MMINEEKNEFSQSTMMPQPSHDKVNKKLLSFIHEIKKYMFLDFRRKEKIKRMAKQKFPHRNDRWKDINRLVSMYRS